MHVKEGEAQKRKLDADRTNLDDQDKASFFCPAQKKKKKTSKSMSDRALDLSSVEAYDEVYQAQKQIYLLPLLLTQETAPYPAC